MNDPPVRAAIEDCNAIGVESITCEVYDASGNRIANGGPWSCDDHSARMERIPVGTDRTFVVLGWNGETEPQIVYHGSTAADIAIRAGEISDAGTINAQPFVPTLNSPADGQTVASHALVLTWHEMANAGQYRVVVSEESSFASPVIEEEVAQTTYTPTALRASTQYYWLVQAIGRHGNKGLVSQPRRFMTDTNTTTDCLGPALSPIGNYQVAEGEALTFTITANDPDSTFLTYSHSSLPDGAAFDADTQTFSWTPGQGDAGNYTVNFSVCDDCADGPLCNAEEITITVGDVCQPPVLSSIGNRQVAEGGALTFTVDASDPDGGVLTFSHTPLPSAAAFDNNTRTFSWTPGFGAAGNYPVTFNVCDNCSDGPQCDSEEVTITVGDVCRPPVLSTIGNRQVAEGDTLSFTVGASDPDGGTLTYSLNGLPTGAAFDSSTHTFSWTPGFGAAGNYPVTFNVCDDCPGGSQCVSEDVTITVGDVCRPPVLSPVGNRQVAEGATLTFTLSASDPDGGSLIYSHHNLPTGAAFDSSTRTFNWTPGFGAAGNYPVTFNVCDDCPGGSQCVSEDVTITVGDVCRPPELTRIGNRQVAEGATLTFTLSASDPDGGVLTYSHDNLPDGATFNNSTRAFRWTPSFGAAGNYAVTFTVCDDCPGGSQCAFEVVTITVGDVCRPPELSPIGNRQVAEGATLAFTLSASDPDGGTLTYSHDGLPAGATFNSSTRNFRWTPGYGAAGNYPVTFRVCDDCPGGSQCVSEPITITVGDVCRPPVLNPIGNRQVTEGDPLAFTLSASDPDGGTLTYRHSTLPAGATFSSRTFSWTPGSNDAGNYSIDFTVCDDCAAGELCVSEPVAISVADDPGGPTCTSSELYMIGDNDGYGFGRNVIPNGGSLAAAEPNIQPGDPWSFENRSVSETNASDGSQYTDYRSQKFSGSSPVDFNFTMQFCRPDINSSSAPFQRAVLELDIGSLDSRTYGDSTLIIDGIDYSSAVKLEQGRWFTQVVRISFDQNDVELFTDGELNIEFKGGPGLEPYPGPGGSVYYKPDTIVFDFFSLYIDIGN